MVLAVVLFSVKLCDPNNIWKFFYSLQSLYGFGRLNCRLCRSACIRCTVHVIGRCLLRISTRTWALPVGLSSFCSVSIGNEHFLSNPFPVHHSAIAAWCSAFWWFPFVSRDPFPNVQVLPSFDVFRIIFIGCAVECGSIALRYTGQEVRAWLPSDNWRLRRKLVIGCRYFP